MQQNKKRKKRIKSVSTFVKDTFRSALSKVIASFLAPLIAMAFLALYTPLKTHHLTKLVIKFLTSKIEIYCWLLLLLLMLLLTFVLAYIKIKKETNNPPKEKDIFKFFDYGDIKWKARIRGKNVWINERPFCPKCQGTTLVDSSEEYKLKNLSFICPKCGFTKFIGTRNDGKFLYKSASSFIKSKFHQT